AVSTRRALPPSRLKTPVCRFAARSSPRMRSSRSATALTYSPMPAQPQSSSPAARYAMKKSSPPPTNTALRWYSPAIAIAVTDSRLHRQAAKKMKVLVIGSGGREHALAWKLERSPKITRVVVAPGNAGTAREARIENLPITAIDELVEYVKKEDIAWTVVGPEAPLAAGVVDAFRTAGLPIFGPVQAAAQLESSKDFAKQFMARHNIPTAKYDTFSHAQAAHA